ncbi:MAG: DUF554 domain-containing protein [bacterium]|nr:DUF554 domain-containing protein [bacterium]
MGGTLLNMLTVALGSALGLLVGNRLPVRIQESIVTGLGLVTFFVGLDNAGQTGNPIIPLLSIALGVIIGELLQLDVALERLGGWLQRQVGGRDTAAGESPLTTDENVPPGETPLSPRDRFITGFVTASLLFCVGPLTFLGSLQDGMGDPNGFTSLAIKSVLDGFASIAFAASFGIGVAFSIVTIFVLQGGLALIGSVLGNFMSAAMMAEMTSTGGLVLMGLSLILLDIKRPRMANFLPALVIAPLIVALAPLLGIDIYPFSG